METEEQTLRRNWGIGNKRQQNFDGGGGRQGNMPLYFREHEDINPPPPLWEGLANLLSAKPIKV